MAFALACNGCCSPSSDPSAETVAAGDGVSKGVAVEDFPEEALEGCPVLKKDNPADDEPIGDLLKEADERQKALLERTRSADPVELVCLEDGSGVSGHGVRVDGRFDQDLWRIGLSCSNWRLMGGETDSRFLYLRNTDPISRAEMDVQQDTIDSYTVVKLMVRLDPETVDDPEALRVDGLIDEILDADFTDSEFESIARERQKPKELDHPFFGLMTLDRSLERYTGRRSLGHGDYYLSIDCNRGCEDPRAVLSEEAEQQVRCTESDLRQVAHFATDDLLDLHNDLWGGHGRLDRKGFLERIRLESISVDETLITIYFVDGGLFEGHVIRAVIDRRTQEVWEATIEG